MLSKNVLNIHQTQIQNKSITNMISYILSLLSLSICPLYDSTSLFHPHIMSIKPCLHSSATGGPQLCWVGLRGHRVYTTWGCFNDPTLFYPVATLFDCYLNYFFPPKVMILSILAAIIFLLQQHITLREAIKKNPVNLGHCPNRERGWLGINFIFWTVNEKFWKIRKYLKTSKTS